LTATVSVASEAVHVSCTIVTAAGLAVAIWARLHLGRDCGPDRRHQEDEVRDTDDLEE